MLTENHEKKLAWTRIWYLTQTKSNGEFEYFPGLSLDERNQLLSDYYDFLDQERKAEVGDRLGDADTTPSEREQDNEPAADPKPVERNTGPLLKIHDPDNYSFGENKKWIPWAEDAPSGPKRGSYRSGYPTGLVLHWTAGHRNGLAAGNTLMRNTGMLYLIGDAEGRLGQSDSLQFHGYHAGKSSHAGASGYVSDEYVGLELQAAGFLKKSRGSFKTWWGGTVPIEEVVWSGKRDNIVAGHYHEYTQDQMMLTRQLCCWLYLNNPDVFSIDRVVGHDEVSPGRKVDPGGSPVTDEGHVLSMPELRDLLWNDVDKINELRKQRGK